MNPAMIMSPVLDERDGSTPSMVEVDAAAARAALADHLELRGADLEHPAVVAVLAAVVAAGWRPPTQAARPEGVLAPDTDAAPSMTLFGDPGDPLEPGWAAAAGVGRLR